MVALPLLVALAGCVTVDFTAPLHGSHGNISPVAKDFIIIGTVSISATEIHSASPLGLSKMVEGSKVTYTDLMQEAARIGADDIIDARIDMNASGEAGFMGWLRGWERTFTHTGEALAIRYVNNVTRQVEVEAKAEVEVAAKAEVKTEAKAEAVVKDEARDVVPERRFEAEDEVELYNVFTR